MADQSEEVRYFTDLAAVQFRVSAYRKTRECERDNTGRIKVFMLGSRFVPMQQVMYRIRRMIHDKFFDPSITWDEFSHRRKDRLFDEFKWYFFWDMNIDERVYIAWEAEASAYLNEVLSKPRISGEKPAWIIKKTWLIIYVEQVEED